MPHSDSRPARVLVAEDDRAIRMLLVEVLQEEGYEVLTASDGNAALQVLAERPMDLVLLDLAMPNRNGLSVLHAVRADPTLQGVRVIVVSAYVSALTASDVARADGLLKKPFDIGELLSLVAKQVADRAELAAS